MVYAELKRLPSGKFWLAINKDGFRDSQLLQRGEVANFFQHANSRDAVAQFLDDAAPLEMLHMYWPTGTSECDVMRIPDTFRSLRVQNHFNMTRSSQPTRVDSHQPQPSETNVPFTKSARFELAVR